jgi:hypothetical protein
MTAAGLALIAGGLATLISFWSVIFGGEARRAARGDASRSGAAIRRRRIKVTSRSSDGPYATAPVAAEAIDVAPAFPELVPPAGEPSIFAEPEQVFAEEVFAELEPAPVPAAFVLPEPAPVPVPISVPMSVSMPAARFAPVSRRRGRRIAEAFSVRPRVVASSPTSRMTDSDYQHGFGYNDRFVPAQTSATTPAEPVRDLWPLPEDDPRGDARFADAFNPQGYGHPAAPGPRVEVDRSDLGYGDRVEDWVRPHYQDLDDRPPAGEYWTPVPDDLYADPEPSARGYGWPVPVERLPQVPAYEPETGFDLTPVEASEPTAFVPRTWPPDGEDRRVRTSRTWRDRDEKRAYRDHDERRSWRDHDERRADKAESRGRRDRPRPRPRPAAAQMPGYVSRHSTDNPE